MDVVGIGADDPHFAEVATLFERYREHYGGAPVPERSQQWLRGRVQAADLRVWAAIREGRVRGLVTVAVLPASILLGTSMVVRDVYVRPESRRTGIARALLTHVVTEARAAGAVRVSLQTEVTNEAARRLYRDLGFEVVDGVVSMSRELR